MTIHSKSPQFLEPSRQPAYVMSARRLLWVIIALISTVFTLSACSPPLREAAPLSDEIGQTTITPAPLPTLTPEPTILPTRNISIWLAWQLHELQGLYGVIERYQENHPEIEFGITYRKPEELLPAYEIAAAQGNAPSILIGPSLWGPALREKGYILNLSPLLDPGMESDVHAIAWTQAAEGSQLFGLPLELQGFVLYRNRTLAPDPVAGVREWVEVVSQYQDDEMDGLNFDLDTDISLPLVSACGIELLDDRDQLILFEEGGPCWLVLLTQMADLGRVLIESDEEVELFKQGRSAWLIGSTELRAELTEAIGVTNLKVDPWPLYESTDLPLRGFTWSENAYLAAGSTDLDLEASWQFLRFLFGPSGQEILGDPGGAAHIPTTSALELTDELMLEASAMLRAGVPYPIQGELDLVKGPLISAIQAVVLQGSEPEFALRLAEERLDLLKASEGTGP